jgi:ketosteroid isomerase-like protein
MDGERTATEAAAGEEIRAWLLEMQSCVRAVDYERARALFLPEVVGFGTYSGVLDGLEGLARDQWGRVWPHIREFTFRLDELRAGVAAAGDLAWAACPWDSLGRRGDGVPFPRPGRVTAVLIRRDGRWRAAHTHFSLYPTPQG